MHSRSHVVTLQFANLPDCAFVERGGPFVPRWELSPACEVSLACNLVNLTASLPPPWLLGAFLNKGATPPWARVCGRSPAVPSRKVAPQK